MQAKSRFIISLFAVVFVGGLSFTAFADTIRLKDGTVVKGKVVGFKDQQFTVLIGDGTRGRRSQLQVYIEDVESIEFENVSDSAIAEVNNTRNTTQPTQATPEKTTQPVSNNSRSNPNVTTTSTLPPTERTANNSGSLSQVINSTPINSPKTSETASTEPPVISTPRTNTNNNNLPGKFIVIRGGTNPLKVLADATANGWTNTGYMVKKGQRIRISATGRVSLGGGRFATPAGVGSLSDTEKLMKTEPTGALIAVIGDDNNDFIFIGNSREFIAQRDGMLFLGVNEGNLDDNSGAFDTTIEAEPLNTAKK
ncbi:MAG: hypothetical protein M3209_11690 [Acidobacteriota bacterium]|nr:hypothetical protein [Acidobacteriota bacterium]